MSQSARAELETIAYMYRQKRYDECIKETKSKLKKSPNSLHLLNYQAMAYSALKRDKEALQSYENIIKKDPSVKGFNLGTNIGKVSGQSILHCHLHLIPRREGDVDNPQGGVRSVIPNKQHYKRSK